MSSLERAHFEHHHRCVAVGAKPLTWVQFVALVSSFIMQDMNTFIKSFQPEY